MSVTCCADVFNVLYSLTAETIDHSSTDI